MNKLIVTLVLAALALNTFAQEREGTHEYGRGHGRMHGHGRGRDRGRGGYDREGGQDHSYGRRRPNPDAKLHRFSTTIEKERPQLNQETRDLIAAYRRDPSEANRAALRRQVAKNYDAVVARKKAKLEELKRTARHQSKVD